MHDAATGRLVRTVPTGDQTLAGLHAVSSRHALFSRSSDAHLFVADLAGARRAIGPLDFAGHWSSAWSPDGKTALAADWKLRRFDRTGALLAEATLDGEVRTGVWSPDGRWYAAGSDRAVAAYAASGNRTLWTSTAVVQPIAVVDRALLAARDREQVGTLVLLDARTGAERGRLVGGELAGTIERLFALPGRKLAAAAWEGRILVWKVP